MIAPTFDFDCTIVGAGAVGLAIGYAASAAGLSVLVLEKEDGVGQGVSSRNSEVVHAGLYYPTDSFRARFCVDGRRRMYAFLQSHGVPHRKCGKILVASEGEDIPRLESVAAQAEINGVEGLEWLDGAQTHRLEPQVRAVASLLSQETGIVDSHAYMLALLGEIEDRGGVLARQTEFLRAEPKKGGGFNVRAGNPQHAFTTGRLVISAGLGAQAAAANVDGYDPGRIPRLRFGRGCYFRLAGRAPFSRLVYPPPIPGALGTHFTLDLGGQGRFGPDLEFIHSESYVVDPSRSARFEADIRRYWPGLPDGALSPDYAGIRPKIHGPGEPQPDFRIDGPESHGLQNLIALYGIESPGLTSSLAIGAAIANRLA